MWSKSLYDGQTKEMLVSDMWEGDHKSATIFSDDLNQFVKDPAFATYEQVDALIDKFMAEDRKP